MAMIMPSAHEVSPVLEELNHGGPTLAIDSEEIFKPERPGASNGKPDFTLRSIGATSARSAVASIRLALRTAAVSQKSGGCIWLFRRPASRAGPGGNAT